MANDSIHRAIEILGSQNALAAVLGIRTPSITGWKDRNRVPAERCAAIEAATGGLVTRHDLRPDIFDAPVETKAA